MNSRLSGMPDISMSLSNSHLIEEYSFHPSVRLSRFAADRVVSFVPADGSFTLMSYKVRKALRNSLTDVSVHHPFPCGGKIPVSRV